MKITAPAPSSRYAILADTTPPKIVFATDVMGAHVWNWQISWRSFKKSGTVSTMGNQWSAQKDFADLGGELRVQATAGGQTAALALTIAGTNPSESEVAAYLKTQPNSDGFIDILRHETKFKHFDAKGQPTVSFDNGVGMAQLTQPPPSYEQAWSWKRNLVGALALFAQKRKEALSYLSQGGRSYSDLQLRKETICRWNGGSYHRWNAKTGTWVRNPNILCDPNTGNIGWDMTKAENVGKSLQTLRTRDKSAYSKPPAKGAGWGNFGVCYADRLLP